MLMYLILLFVVILIYFNSSLNIDFIQIESLPVYLATRYALKLLDKPNTKENRKSIYNLCSSNNHFTEDFIKYSKRTSQLKTIKGLGLTIYSYVNESLQEEMNDN